MKNLSSILICAVLFSLACSKNDDDVKPTINTNVVSKVIVVNEGGFGNSNGSLTLINLDNNEIQNDIIGNANNGISTGDVVQSIYKYGGKLFLISNNENKVLIFNEQTFKQEAVIETNLKGPRYMNIQEDKIFITNWNSDFGTGETNSYVAIFDLNDFSFKYQIPTDNGTERILFDGTNFWVTNNFTNTVQTFGLNDKEVKKSIQVFSAPNGLDKNNENVFVICQGGFGSGQGYIYQISLADMSKTDSFDLEFNPDAALIKGPNDKFYFSRQNRLFASDFSNGLNLNSEEVSLGLTNLNQIYGMGIRPNGEIWLSDAKGFTGAGEVYRFKSDGTKIQTYEVGIAPNGFLFY